MSKDLQQEPVSRPLDLINKVCLVLGTICMLVMALIVAINVVGRYFFHSPLPATMELVGLAAAVLISVSLLPSQLTQMNISVPIVVDRLGPRVLKAFKVCALALSILLAAILAWTGIIYGWETLLKNEKTNVLLLPLGPFRLIWALGCLLLLIVLIVQFLQLLRRGGK